MASIDDSWISLLVIAAGAIISIVQSAKKKTEKQQSSIPPVYHEEENDDEYDPFGKREKMETESSIEEVEIKEIPTPLVFMQNTKEEDGRIIEMVVEEKKEEECQSVFVENESEDESFDARKAFIYSEIFNRKYI